MEKILIKIAWYVFITMLLTATAVAVISFKGTKIIVPERGNLGGLDATYTATTTPEKGTNIDSLLKTGFGSLGSVVITTAGDTRFDLLNATTTDINKRTNKTATSSILIASFPASMAVGDYQFNASFNYGLYFDVITGSMGTTTITFN